MLGPIFNREVITVPRHARHYLIRTLYLGLLLVTGVTFWQTLYGWGKTVTLGDYSHFGVLFFQLLSFLQLTLVIFFSSLFAAAAVAQEKDRRTFILLLMTDLRNHELVLGKLMGSLMQMSILLIAALPVLGAAVLLGGTTFLQVIDAFLVLFGSALAAGSLGCMIALWRDRTFQTLAVTVLSLVLYLVLVEGLGLLSTTFPSQEANILFARECLNPYRVLVRILSPNSQQFLGLLSLPFFFTMLGITIVINLISILMLRVWNPSNERMRSQEDVEDESENELVAGRDRHAAPGKLRGVWENPIAWREIATRAYGTRPLVIKALFLVVIGVLIWAAVNSLERSDGSFMSADEVSRFSLALTLVPMMILSFILVNAQAVTSITSERDLGALELLLVTELTPYEFIFGKVRGILYNAKEMIVPPLLFICWLGWMGYIPIETFVFVIIVILVLYAFIIALGIHVALSRINTRLAIGLSLGTVFFIFVCTFLCIYLIWIGGQFEVQITNFAFFLFIGIGGLWMVLSGDKPSSALFLASVLCPVGLFYAITNVMVGNVRTGGGGDALWPFLVVVGAFGFTIAAIAVPLLSEFHVAIASSVVVEDEETEKQRYKSDRKLRDKIFSEPA
ncbi:MAG TPA: ABC transporter permease [Gemmatales bacterium]|nr:ABC transporter permease [Gemmatales bacterium]